MADYIFPENPEYITAIRQLESTDPANAALFNDLFEKLIGNTHAVKLETDNKSDVGHTHLPGDCGLGKNLTFTGAVTGTYNGQTAKTVFIPDRKDCRFIVGTSTNGWTEKDCDYLCDGTADQVEIQAAINALPSGGGEIVILDGVYDIAQLITINKSNVTLLGNGTSTELLWTGDLSTTYIREIIYIRNASYVTIKNLFLNGDLGVATGSLCGVCLTTSNNCIITNLKVKNTKYGVYITKFSGEKPSCENIISNNIFDNNKYGVEISSGTDNLVTNNAVVNVLTVGIEGSGGERNSIVNNLVRIASSDAHTIFFQSSEKNDLVAGNLIFGKNYYNGGTNNTFINNKYN